MTVYASTACLRGVGDLWDAIDAYGRSGVHAVELGFGRVEETGDALVERLCGTGLRYLIHNYFPPPRQPFVLNLSSPDPALAERSIRFACDAIELAARIGAPVYSVHGGFVTDPVEFDGTGFVFPEPDSPSAVEDAEVRYYEALERPLARADELGVRLLVENNVCSEDHVGKLLLQRPEEFERLFDAVPSATLGALIDFGHLNVSARVLGFDRDDLVEAVAPRVGGAHVHDNSGLSDEHEPVAPDGWVVRALQRPEYAGLPLTVEAKFDDPASLAEHIHWLERETASLEA